MRVLRAMATVPSSGSSRRASNIQQGRFPRAIGADKPDAVMLINLKTDSFKDALGPKRFSYLYDTDDWHELFT